MARLFDNGSSEYIEIDQAVVSAEPYTISCWFNTDDLANDQYIVNISDKDAVDNQSGLFAYVSQANDPLAAVSYDAGGANVALQIGITANTWHHGAGVWAANNDRAVFLNGNKGTDNNARNVANQDRTSIGRAGDSTPSYYMSGAVAEVGIWNVALTDDEVDILAAGYSPLFVRPQSLVFYMPLVRDNDEDIVGGLSLTAVNTPTIVSHPPVTYPAPPFNFFGAAGAPPIGVAPTSHIYGPLIGPLGGPV